MRAFYFFFSNFIPHHDSLSLSLSLSLFLAHSLTYFPKAAQACVTTVLNATVIRHYTHMLHTHAWCSHIHIYSQACVSTHITPGKCQTGLQCCANKRLRINNEHAFNLTVTVMTGPGFQYWCVSCKYLQNHIKTTNWQHLFLMQWAEFHNQFSLKSLQLQLSVQYNIHW